MPRVNFDIKFFERMSWIRHPFNVIIDNLNKIIHLNCSMQRYRIYRNKVILRFFACVKSFFWVFCCTNFKSLDMIKVQGFYFFIIFLWFLLLFFAIFVRLMGYMVLLIFRYLILFLLTLLGFYTGLILCI